MCYGMECLFESSHNGECRCNVIGIKKKYKKVACVIGDLSKEDKELERIREEILKDKKLYM